MSFFRTTLGALLVAGMLAADAGYGVAQTGETAAPESHDSEWWRTHGKDAQANAQLCDVCHAREYCTRCHVNEYDVPEIQGLSSDPDAAAYVASREWPAPPTHTPFFLEGHQAAAASATASCSVCHVVEQQCQSCHLGSETLERPRDSNAPELYHPMNFLQIHSAAAWNQEAECTSCHNPEVFCRSCHTTLGYASRDGSTVTGFHNENQNFVLGHGQAARQGLEACASCHAQQDCLQCHSARFGRRVNPHGPGFDAEKLRSKNRGLCLFCHFSVPGEP
ncbi:MAG: hypothetical protein GWN99_10700 [Gemmatimonadetes bacterium]|uniref:Uncharacterized protein n=1 Tax=Candidatus Kutchimonas denitrificans TaxID=3056748 RepID=A0AAE4Z6Q4_9BACT|nr:hypothetical protein [Gemmatimonadota bacterium]NIR74765.1 hypothetical protein [Candidatus Kutchimonas denitrificans]NIS01515.1 hypothetical protein [Gemmatimonadota bacterium]NIT67256.1 hypothetical protein [Gemmatimonadota bacterium]NIU52430.1 hypothetical protein [Gemmatimonadota bacterium]